MIFDGCYAAACDDADDGIAIYALTYAPPSYHMMSRRFSPMPMPPAGYAESACQVIADAL